MKSARLVVGEENPVNADGRPKSSIDVVLAEGYPILLAGMEHLLASHADVRVVAKCVDGDEALSAVRTYRPDVLVSDLRLPVRNGLLVLRDLTNEGLRTRVVLLAERIYEDETLEAIRLGARGIMLKQMSANLLIQCIRKVHAGERWLEKETVGRAVEHLLHRDAGAKEVALLLTPRELEVLRAVATGMRNKEISARLHITEGTVKIHLHNVYEKLDVKGRLELTLCARDRGWV